jgi:hypothetical protein
LKALEVLSQEAHILLISIVVPTPAEAMQNFIKKSDGLRSSDSVHI